MFVRDCLLAQSWDGTLARLAGIKPTTITVNPTDLLGQRFAAQPLLTVHVADLEEPICTATHLKTLMADLFGKGSRSTSRYVG